jgi:hypothetical protein
LIKEYKKITYCKKMTKSLKEILTNFLFVQKKSCFLFYNNLAETFQVSLVDTIWRNEEFEKKLKIWISEKRKPILLHKMWHYSLWSSIRIKKGLMTIKNDPCERCLSCTLVKEGERGKMFPLGVDNKTLLCF